MRKGYALLLMTLSLLVVTSCGYQWGQGTALGRGRTLSIPYVEDDWDGQLTAALVQEITRAGTFLYRPHGGSLTLVVNNVDLWNENIGFRYDRNKRGQFESRVIPDEGRLSLAADISVVETSSGATVLAPVRLSSSVDFDHDYYDNRDGVNVFSLGQLTDYEEAYDAAQRPLFQRFAQKVSDYLNNAYW